MLTGRDVCYPSDSGKEVLESVVREIPVLAWQFIQREWPHCYPGSFQCLFRIIRDCLHKLYQYLVCTPFDRTPGLLG